MIQSKTDDLRLIPSVDEVLGSGTVLTIIESAGTKHVTELVRVAVEEMRQEILSTNSSQNDLSRDGLLSLAAERVESLWQKHNFARLRKVINATGVIIHTNLGRAPLSIDAKDAFFEAAGYCNVEYDIATGKRGKRGERVESLVSELTGAEAAIVVNNCAAAAFFILSVFGKGRDVVISRGELVEIGGDFRVPDVLAQSGSNLKEVGSTNRTKLSDYERALGENTAMILRVHPSNYRIVGFTETPKLSDLAKLAHGKGVLLYEDAGSGALIDLTAYGLSDEPLISQSIADGADLVSFSGDKLLGGSQAGIIAGRSELVARLRKHPLYRALRVDKLSYALLEATLESYVRGTALTEIPVIKALSMSCEEIENRARGFLAKLESELGDSSTMTFDLIDGESVIGGGSAPDVHPKTKLISVRHDLFSAYEIETGLRQQTTPVISRIVDNMVVIDLRTVEEDDEMNIVAALQTLSLKAGP
ncbi:MAG: L-seryl-tRNA(Sec) selenium transferase [Blastocatellia bacterium]